MKRTALLIMIITIISKIFGFGREISLSYFYGASNISDAYLISITIPSVIFGFVAGGLGAGFIPMYNKIVEKDGELRADKFTSNFINILLGMSMIVLVIGLVFTCNIVRLFAVGFDRDTFEIAVKLTRISLLAIFFPGIVSVLSGYLQIHKNYFIPALVGIPLNLFVVLSIVLSYLTSISILSIGFVVAIASQIVLMVPFVKKNGYNHTLKIDIKDKYIKRMVYIAIPVILGTSVNQINTLVDRTLASQIVVGGISALNYASKLNSFVHGIFVLSIATALYPRISKMAAESNIIDLKKTVSEAMTGINMIVTPITIGTIIFAHPIVNILFGRGEFDYSAVSMTSDALIFYSVGMVAMGHREILSRTFYSVQQTKIPMINATIGMIINVILNFVLSKYMGIGGLALATSFAAIITTILMIISLKKLIGPLGMRNVVISFLKILFASFLMGTFAKLSFSVLTNYLTVNFSLLLAITFGAVSYFMIIYFMKIEEVDIIVEAIKNKLV